MLHLCSIVARMQSIVTYLDQLRALAAPLNPEDPERLVRLAFDAAGVPSSTYYRALYGADLRSDTAAKVAHALHALDRRTDRHGGREAKRAAAAAM